MSALSGLTGNVFIYKDTVTVSRLPSALIGGVVDNYAAARQADYVNVPGLIDIPASVQAQRGGGVNPPRLPTDTKRSDWFILLLIRNAAAGTVKRGDRITDQLGRIFTAQVDYAGSLGYRIQATSEEA